jgi:hypothetical protein
MSKQTAGKNQASRSDVHDSMPNVYGEHSKASQKPESAHVYQGQRTSLDPCESRDRTPKRKPEAGHKGPRSVSEPDETITKKNRETKR